MASPFKFPERADWPKAIQPEITPFHTQIVAPRQTPDQIKSWVEELGRLNQTNWTMNRCAKKSPKFDFRLTFACHHCADRKSLPLNTSRKSKNLNCPAKIQVAVRRDEITYLKVIEINSDHSHPLYNAAVLGCLPATPETKLAFQNYFKDGMGITASLNHHRFTIHKFNEQGLADASLNPKYDVVKRWYNKWHEAKVGPRDEDVLKILQEKKAEYAKVNVEIQIREDPFCIVIMTELMRRAQLYADNIVFLDSTASCDNDSYTVTFMLVDTEAGSVPIAIMITKGQTMREYETCFRVVREMMGTEGFGGNSAPEIFMTDDSDAERGALTNVCAIVYIVPVTSLEMVHLHINFKKLGLFHTSLPFS